MNFEATKIDRVTGAQVQYLADRFGLRILHLDFTENKALIQQDGRNLKTSTVCKMLGLKEESNAIVQSGKQVEVRF